MLLFADIETFNKEPIKNGSHKYSETAELLLFGYAIDDGPAKVWDATTEWIMPDDLKNALIASDTLIVFHNGMMFDSVVLRHCLPEFDWNPNRIVDSMVLAYQHGLPGALSDLCKALGLPDDLSKEKDGTRLVNLFCKPLPESRKIRRATKATHPEDWVKFINYCRMDIVSMREVFNRLPKFNATKAERAIQLVDAKINMRGVQIDLDLAKGALALDRENKDRLAEETIEKTGGAVGAATQRDRLMAYIESEYGWKVESLTKAEIERKVEADDVPEPVKDLLRLRLASAATSAKKYERVLEAVSSDGRLRGTLQFRGASRTGRFSGRLFQPQNMARPAFKEEGFFEAIELIKSGYAASFYEDVKPVLSTCLRGLMVAKSGYTFCVADYSNVEGRVLAWLSGEDWKLKAFRDYDAGTGHDLYKLTYGRTFGIKPEDVTKPQRQMGKVLELAMGYGGGAGAFVTFANGYSMNLDKVAGDIHAAVDPATLQEAQDSWEWFVKNDATCGLSEYTFVAVDAVKRAWRKANPAIVQFWNDCGKAVVDAISNPGDKFKAGPCVMLNDGTFLRIRLPSGRFLCYAKPKLSEEKQGSFTYLGVDQKVRRWGRLESYAGKVVENITQATACDVLCQSLVTLDYEKFSPVMHVHDEIICEVPESEGESRYKRMCEIMAHPGEIYEGLPLSVDGFVGNRYKKKD